MFLYIYLTLIYYLFQGLYSHQNPFEKITDEELEMYRREIEIKNNPELIKELEHSQDVISYDVTEDHTVDSGAGTYTETSAGIWMLFSIF